MITQTLHAESSGFKLFASQVVVSAHLRLTFTSKDLLVLIMTLRKTITENC